MSNIEKKKLFHDEFKFNSPSISVSFSLGIVTRDEKISYKAALRVE